MQYQIGDLSRISRLSIKTLRYYHECGLLEPSFIDQESGYRYYDESSLVRAGIINELKEYETIGESYKVLIDYINESGLKVESPSREVYIKGPGLILPRSPKKFITEIQMFLSSHS